MPKTLLQGAHHTLAHGGTQGELSPQPQDRRKRRRSITLSISSTEASIAGMPAFPSRAFRHCSPAFRHLLYRFFLLAPMVLNHLSRARVPSSGLGFGGALTRLMSFSRFSCSPSFAVICVSNATGIAGRYVELSKISREIQKAGTGAWVKSKHDMYLNI